MTTYRTTFPLAAALVASVSFAAETTPMQTADRATADVANALAKLTARFAYDATKHSLRVDATVAPAGNDAVMIIDRGVSVGGKPSGGNAPYAKLDGDALTLTHAAMPLPNPAHAVPRIPLAARAELGTSHVSSFVAEIPDGTHKVRYCVAVAPFAADAFTQDASDATSWRASFNVADSQQLLCTPWFAIGTGEFGGDH
jgi:hypothetical protein